MTYQKSKAFSLFGIVIFSILFAGIPARAQGEQGLVKAENGETGFYYTIQKGDTLWDLSKKFYNSQWDWPGLWEMNKDIKNPHRIKPGEKIRVFLKSRPQEAQETPEPQALKKIPDPITPTFIYPAIDRVGFIKETAEESLGKIIRERDGNLMMSTDDIVYITPAGEGTLVTGQTYHIFNVEPVKEKFNGDWFKGIKHVIKAEVEILENTDGYAVGRIKAAYRDVSEGDMLMAFSPRPAELKIQENPDPIDAVIVCSEDNTVMINDYRIGFINRGSRDNIRPGQIYAILQPEAEQSVFGDRNKLHVAPLFAGRLIVLRSEGISATVMVMSSKRDIHPGDMVN